MLYEAVSEYIATITDRGIMRNVQGGRAYEVSVLHGSRELYDLNFLINKLVMYTNNLH